MNDTFMKDKPVLPLIFSMAMPMVALLVGCITNIILDPIFIFRLGPFPALSVEGAAIATGIGQSATVVVYLVVYARRPTAARLGRQYLAPVEGLERQLYSVGIPATLNLALPSLLVSALNAILSQYGQMYVVILGIYYKLQTFLYLTANGLVQGMRPIIGYNYGAKEYKRVGQIYTYTLAMNAIIMFVGTLICLLVPERLMGLYVTNPETISAGAMALRIISGGFIISSVSVTTSGALEGLEKGTPSFVISLFRYVVIIIPVTIVMGRIWEPVGVWNAFWIAEGVTAVVALVIYRRVNRRE